jgi:hypothetical protein
MHALRDWQLVCSAPCMTLAAQRLWPPSLLPTNDVTTLAYFNSFQSLWQTNPQYPKLNMASSPDH